MRILVLQLARFGDIYQSWPALRALQRTHPGAEIHVLVRARFREALTGLTGVTVHELKTADILAPILEGGDDSAALARLSALTEELSALRFERVINLSFSPFSSYLTDAIAPEGCQVTGYTRHSDGFLAIPDDSSAYFYAQVGIGRANRYHLTEVFAAVSGVDLIDEDFTGGEAPAPRESRVLLHLGASQAQKIYPAELWAEVARTLRAQTTFQIAVIGSADERALAESVCAQAPGVICLAGQTKLPELMQLIARSRLVIGADSAPVHIAALTGTPVLNLSSSTVNFWETGPLTPGSRVLYCPNISDIRPQDAAAQAQSLLNGEEPAAACFVRRSRQEMFQPVEVQTEDFAWNLIQALYTGAPYPKAENASTRLAFQRLFELAELALQQLAKWNGSEPTAAARILSSIDEMLPEVGRICPDVEPLIQWFQTQRLRLPPSDPAATLKETRRLFEELLWVTAVYHQPAESASEIRRALELCAACAPELREFEFSSVESRFQELLSVLQNLARHSTNVDGRDWSSVLMPLQEALSRQDFIDLADRLEFELPALLAHASSESETLAPDVVS